MYKDNENTVFPKDEPPRRSLNIPIAHVGENHSQRRLREENRRILGKRRKAYRWCKKESVRYGHFLIVSQYFYRSCWFGQGVPGAGLITLTRH